MVFVKAKHKNPNKKDLFFVGISPEAVIDYAKEGCTGNTEFDSFEEMSEVDVKVLNLPFFNEGVNSILMQSQKVFVIG